MSEVRCPSCGFANPVGFRFCGSCGASLLINPLTPVPSSVPYDVTPRARRTRRIKTGPLAVAQKTLAIPTNPVLTASYLPPTSAFARGERRNITVFFADLSDYTPISADLDAEELYYITNRALQTMAEQISLFEGTVDKFIGDGVMAVFGAPKSHENNSERALLAALGIMEAIEELNEELADHLVGRRLQVHIGANAGLAVAVPIGDSSYRQYTMIGDTVNIAARLTQSAPAGQILIGEAVYGTTAALFDFQEMTPLKIKGKDAPLKTFELLGIREKPESRRGLPGAQTPMVGRATELATLLQKSAGWLKRGDRQIVMVTGEAGIGKSRLADEWRRKVESNGSNIKVLEGFCLSYAHNTPFWPLLDMLRSYFEVAPDDEANAIADKIDARVQQLAPDRFGEVAPYIKHILAVNNSAALDYLQPAELRKRIIQALGLLFGAEAQRQPLVLIFDDLHWADEVSIDTIANLQETLARFPVLLYLISRPLSDEVLRRLGSQDSARFTLVQLGPLSEGESNYLLAALRLPALPADLLEAITDKAEGNPFYLEELIRMLVYQQVLQQQDGRWLLNPGGEMRYLSVPQNLQDLIMARYDRLGEALKHTVATAAVIGRSFRFELLSQLLDEAPHGEMQRRLHELEQSYFVRARQSENGLEYSFVHSITRETIYNSLLRRTREELHQRIGELLEAQYAGRFDEFAEELAYHFRNSRAYEKAVGYLLRAGKKAAARYANDEARNYFNDALDALQKLGPNGEFSPNRAALQVGQGDLLVFAGNYEQARSEYEKALHIALYLNNTAEQVAILRRMAVTHRLRGEMESAREDCFAAIRSLAQAQKAGQPLNKDEKEAAAAVYDELGWLYFQQGHIEEAANTLRQALSFVEHSQAYGALASIYGHLGGVSFRRAAWDEAERYVNASLSLQEILGDVVGQGRCYINLGAVSKLQGAWNRAIQYYNRAISILGKINHQELLALAHGNLGILLCDQGDLAQAEQHLSLSLSIARQLANPYQLVLSLKNVGYYYIAAQDWPQATCFIEQGLIWRKKWARPN